MQGEVSAIVLSLICNACAVAQPVAVNRLPPVRIILVGDSTVAPLNDWGPGFCAGLAPRATCLNLAKNGRSTSSYRAEGSWAEVIKELDRTLAPWAEATKKVAAEEGVPLLDLNSDSAAAVQRMGPAEANALAMAPPPPVPGSPAGQANGAAEPRGDPAAVFDYTHLGEKGAALFGRMVAGELLRAVPDLRPYVSR